MGQYPYWDEVIELVFPILDKHSKEEQSYKAMWEELKETEGSYAFRECLVELTQELEQKYGIKEE